jgi:hypothetical protein
MKNEGMAEAGMSWEVCQAGPIAINVKMSSDTLLA